MRGYKLELYVKACVFYLLSLIMSVQQCIVHEPLVTVLISFVISCLVLYSIFGERRKYYFVSFICDGRYGRVYIPVDGPFVIMAVEKKIGEKVGSKAVVMNYGRISRYEYLKNIGYAEDKAGKK